MRLLSIGMLAAAIALAGCSTIEKLSGTDVPTSQIIAAANGVDASQVAATAYIRYCTPNPSPAGCSDAVVQKIINAVKDVRIARNAAEQFLIDNPDAKLGPATLVSAVNSAVATLNQIEAANAIPKKS